MPTHFCPLLAALIALLLPVSLWAATTPPPWQPPPGGLSFTVEGVTNIADLHGEPENPDLVLFFGGNQFMALPEIMDAFRRKHPQYQRIFFETLPPGILERQIETGSLTLGNLRITHEPDLFIAGEQRLRRLDKEKGWFSTITPYLQNRLAIMVRQGNPKGVASLRDLGRDDVAVSMPNPQTEGIAQQVITLYERLAGDELVRRIMETKVARGATFITEIHHRQTPMRIMAGQSDAGPVWITEALFQRQLGHAIDMVELPAEENVTATTAAGLLRNAPHAQAARHFLTFLLGEEASSIYRRYGFQPLMPMHSR